MTGEKGEVAFVDQAYTGEQAAQEAATEGIRFEVVQLPEATHGSVRLPERGVGEHSFSRASL